MAYAWKNAHSDIRVAAGAHGRRNSLGRTHRNRRIGGALNDQRRAAYLAVVRDGIDPEETAFVRGEIFQGLVELFRELSLPICFRNSTILEYWLLHLIPSDFHS